MLPTKFNKLGVGGQYNLAKPLTLTAVEDGAIVQLTAVGSPTVSGLRYRTNRSAEFTAYTIDTEISLDTGDYVQFENTNNTFSTSSSNYFKFVLTKGIKASGNVQSLLNYSVSPVDNCFYALFQNCTDLLTAPILPAKTLATSCYYSMFQGCTSLVTAPELPATALGYACYNSMFRNCTSLVNAPVLNATTLTGYCYNAMFYGCTSLVNAPVLPATVLSNSCYQSMFQGCTSLVNVPDLPATTLINNCYQSMFQGCTSLVNAPDLPATTVVPNCYISMFANCTSLVNAPDLPATTLEAYCYQSMFSYCTSLINSPKIGATTLATQCCFQMFAGCSNLKNGPTLYATTLTTGCYTRMFASCQHLDNLKVYLTTWDNENSVDWLTNVASTGTFICPAELTIPSRDANGVPIEWNVIKKLAYLESTGTQYIDTGVKPNFTQNDEIYIEFNAPTFTGSSPCIFGSRQVGLKNGVYALAGGITVMDNTDYSSYAFNFSSSDDSWTKINHQKITSNVRNYEYDMDRHPVCAFNIYLFALNSNESMIVPYSGLKIYNWKYYRNGVLIQNLIPALDNNDVPCLYNVVDDTFIYNAGTGTFNYA